MIDNFLSSLFNSAGEYVDDAISSFGSSSLFDNTLSDISLEKNYEEITDEAEIEKISKDLSNFQSGFGLGTDSPEAYDAFKDKTGIIVKDGKYYKEKPTQAPAAPVEKQGALTGVQGRISSGQSAPTPGISYGRDVSNSPYTTPSYLVNSQVYNQAVGKLLTGLLNQQTRNPSITTLI